MAERNKVAPTGPAGASEEQVRALLDRYKCPVAFHEVRTRFLGSIATPSVPYIKGDLYSELLTAALDDEPWPPPDPGPVQKLPHSWDEIAPGHVVIAKQTFECGWWEAVVVERNGDLLTLTHRDYPRIPKIKRHRSAIALISAPAP